MFNTVTTNSWKVEILVFIVYVFWKYLGRFLQNKSMHDGLFGFLKQVNVLRRLLRFLALEKSFKQFSFN